MESTTSKGFNILLGLAAFVIVVAGIQSASAIFVTLLLSSFIAILCAPSFLLMRYYKIPAVVAITLLMGILVVIQVGFVSIAAKTIKEFSNDLPIYEEKFKNFTVDAVTQLNELGLSVSPDFIQANMDPAMGFQIATSTLSGLGSIASNVFIILLAVLFILLEASSFPHKLKHAFGGDAALDNATRFLKTVKLYMGIKTGMSLVTGILIYTLLSVIGVDYPLVWALVAFMFNFVPSIGSVIAAVPAIMLTLVQLGATEAAMVLAGYAVINILLGNIIEPRLMGRGMGLSPVVVFLSLLFWGWVLGPVGMLLSVPLTVLFKIALDGGDETRWISILLGPDMTDEDFRNMRSKKSIKPEISQD